MIATIVGKGPSLEHLRAEHLSGTVFALNDSLVSVMRVWDAPVFSLQQDGCTAGGCHSVSECDGIGDMVRPRDTDVLVLHHRASCRCIPEHPLRMVYDPAALGLPDAPMSVFVAIALARLMGASMFRMVAFDSVAVGDLRSLYQRGGDLQGIISVQERSLRHWAPEVRRALSDVPCEWVTPC